jgi:hypothetical protein
VEAGAPPGSTTTGQANTCNTPSCAADSNGDCGCTATANGNLYYMGCQAGGQCVCGLGLNPPSGNAFDENGACGAVSTMQAQFIENCPCP